MTISYIPFTFTSGTYRAKVKASYVDVNNSTHTKEAQPYTFTVTKTIPPEPFNASYIKEVFTSSNEKNYFSTQYSDSTYNSRMYTSYVISEIEGPILSSSSEYRTLSNGEEGVIFSATFGEITKHATTYCTTLWTRNGVVRAPDIRSTETTETLQSTSIVPTPTHFYSWYLENIYTVGEGIESVTYSDPAAEKLNGYYLQKHTQYYHETYTNSSGTRLATYITWRSIYTSPVTT